MNVLKEVAMNEFEVENFNVKIDRAYLAGILKGVSTCKMMYASSPKKDELQPAFDSLIEYVKADLAMSFPNSEIPRA